MEKVVLIVNPATEQCIGSVPIGSTDDVEKAVAAARTAFPSWSQSSIEERQGYLNAISAAIAAPDLPATINPAKTGASSRVIDKTTTLGIALSAENLENPV